MIKALQTPGGVDRRLKSKGAEKAEMCYGSSKIVETRICYSNAHPSRKPCLVLVVLALVQQPFRAERNCLHVANSSLKLAQKYHE